MSAPLSARLPNKDVYNFIIRSNVYQILLLLILTFLPWNSKTILDLVSNCLRASEVVTLVILVSNFIVGICLPQKSVFIKKTVSFRVRSLIKGCCIYLFSAIFFHVIAVMYGAPFFESALETFHFGTVLATTALSPGLFLLGLNLSTWIRVFAQNSAELGPESVVQISSICSIVGAWVGAFPIPLDWDRDWQVWPITCVVGSLLGYMTGLFIATVHLCVRYNQLKKAKIT